MIRRDLDRTQHIARGHLDDPQVVALLQEHLAHMHATSPPGSVHALSLDGLREAGVSFYTLWEGEQLLGCGALNELDATHGEIKSMRTVRTHLGRGVASRMLTFLLDTARERNYQRVSLETGTGEAFEPALALYRKFGFIECGPFADYRLDPFSVFMTLPVTT